MTDLPLIFRISGEILNEKTFLIIEPPDQKRHYGHEREKAPKRPQCKRRTDQIQQCACIHRVPYSRVRSGRNDLLILGDFDSGISEGVFFVNKEHEIEPNHNESFPGYNAGERHYRPLEAVVERRDNQKGDKAN